MSESTNAFRLEGPDERGIGVIWFDRPDKKVNTLSVSLMGEIEELLNKVTSNKAIKSAVLISGKEAGFVAGADIDDLGLVSSAADGAKLSRDGHRLMDAIETLGIPTVAAIHGDCLGGGLELALAATARIAAEWRGAAFDNTARIAAERRGAASTTARIAPQQHDAASDSTARIVAHVRRCKQAIKDHIRTSALTQHDANACICVLIAQAERVLPSKRGTPWR